MNQNSHYLAADSPQVAGHGVALCRRFVPLASHATAPACQQCRRILAQDEQAIEALKAMPNYPPVSVDSR